MYHTPFDKLYAAEVIDNNDAETSGSTGKGKIQFFIEPLHWGLGRNSRDKLPWARPYHNILGGSNEFGSSVIPENDTIVWIWYEDDVNKKNPYYITGLNLNQLSPHHLFDQEVKPNLTDSGSISDTDYPDMKFIYSPNGICVFFSTSDSSKEIGIFHPSGAFIHIDNDGVVRNKGGKEDEDLQKSLLGETVNKMMDEIITQIQQISVPTIGGPSGPPINSSAFETIRTNYLSSPSGSAQNILSENVKNN